MKTLKTITIILSIIIISAISFLGIYQKDEYRVRNLIPEYKLSMHFTKQKKLTMTPDDSIKETKIYDKDGKLVENKEEGVEYTEEHGYRTEEIRMNDSTVLNEENYKKTKDIVLKRLYGLNIGEYEVNFNKEAGKIEITVQENDDADKLEYYLNQSGKIALKDEVTKEVLLDEKNLKDVKTLYGSNLNEKGENVGYVYLQLIFDKEGTAKLQELNNIYVETKKEVENEKGEKEEKTEEKKLTVELNGQELVSTVMKNLLYNNTITLTIGASANTSELEQQRKNAINTKKILESGTLPIVYKVTSDVIEPNVNKNISINIYTLIIMALMFALCIYTISKYKMNGLLMSYLIVAHFAITLIMCRVANVVLTESGLFGILVGVYCNYVLLLQVVKKESNFKKVLTKHVLDFIPLYILAIILSFTKITYLNSFGMVIVWSGIVAYLSNLIFTEPLLDILKEGIKHEKN